MALAPRGWEGRNVNSTDASGARKRWKVPRWGWLLILLITLVAIGYEARTSALQSRLLWSYARQASYKIGPGPSSRIAFPKFGPFNSLRGYATIPQFLSRLVDQGFQVKEQAVFSPGLARLAAWGITPPYREPASTGLLIHGAGGLLLYNARPDGRMFRRYEDVPEMVIKSLLYIENRELDEPAEGSENPVVEWDRLAKAGLTYAASRLGLPVHVQGGSTLATQLEKYRHSLDGRTRSPMDKLRQMTAASLLVYRDGTDTRASRREIILDYLNTVPLAAAPGYGEVYGLGDGLHVWFGQSLEQFLNDLRPDRPSGIRAQAFRQALTLLCAARAPSQYLMRDRAALEARVTRYIDQLQQTGAIEPEFAMNVRKASVRFILRAKAPFDSRRSFALAKSVNSIRTNLLRMLGMRSLYDLDRLDLNVETTLDQGLQHEVEDLFLRLKQPEFLAENGLLGERMLSEGEPADVLYSFLLFEKTAAGNALRVVADNLDQPFDLNGGMKLELGSTAKLRTLANYLEVMAGLYGEISHCDPATCLALKRAARDPLTTWAVEEMSRNGKMTVDDFLAAALERTYSASPREAFFTGGGLHTFSNFDRHDDGRILTVREGLVRSVNLIYIRVMRDLTRFYESRLDYDPQAVLSQPGNPLRKRMLEEISRDEARLVLDRAYRGYRGLSQNELIDRLLGERAMSPRHLAILFFAWRRGKDETDLSRWLTSHLGSRGARDAPRLFRAYRNPNLTLADYGYLLDLHPLDVWCTGVLLRQPDVSWKDLMARSEAPRRISYAWLLDRRNRQAQDLRLRIRFERDAFELMGTYWRRIGFPFETLVPSYATALGSSSDRPAALAELMGIIVNEGIRRPTITVSQLRFGENTPYHTVVEPASRTGEQAMSASVARALRGVLSEVVEKGTARRVAGAFQSPEGTPVEIGGKTGSGDNRFKTFARHGLLRSSRAVNRTATFAFQVGGRYFGVVTAYVPGQEAEGYDFTSALPVAMLKLLAPAIDERLGGESKPTLHAERSTPLSSSTEASAPRAQVPSSPPAKLPDTEAGSRVGAANSSR